MSPLSVYTSVEYVHTLAEFIEEHEELAASLIEHYCENLEDAKEALENYATSITQPLAS